MNLESRIAHLNRHRTPTALYKSSDWWKALDDEGRHIFETRIGMCVGAGLITKEAYALGQMDLENSGRIMFDTNGNTINTAK
jgi:hypothetical protein